MNDVERSADADREQPTPPEPAAPSASTADEPVTAAPEPDEEPVPHATYEPL